MKHFFTAEKFGNTPGLGDATFGIMGIIAVEDFGDTSEAGTVFQMAQERIDYFSGLFF